jgi:hypothetical protein
LEDFLDLLDCFLEAFLEARLKDLRLDDFLDDLRDLRLDDRLAALDKRLDAFLLDFLDFLDPRRAFRFPAPPDKYAVISPYSSSGNGAVFLFPVIIVYIITRKFEKNCDY